MSDHNPINESEPQGDESNDPWSAIGGSRKTVEPKRLGKAAALQILRRRFTSNNARLIGVLFAAIFMGLFGLAMLFGFFAILHEQKNGDPGSNSNAGWVLVAGLACLAGAAFLAFYSLRNMGGQVLIYSNGFLHLRFMASTVCLWNEIDVVWSRSIVHVMNGGAVDHSIDLQIQMKDGTRTYIASTYLHMEELANLVIREATKRGATHRPVGKYWNEL